MNDPKAVEEAKKKYQELFEESVDVKVHHDDFGYASKYAVGSNPREMLSEFVANLFDGMNTQNEREAWLNDLNEVYKPQIYFLKSLDLAADDPVYRQLVLDLEFQLNAIIDNRFEMGKFPTFKGNPNFWQILDNSFDAETRKKLQAVVKNYVASVADTTPAIRDDIPPQKNKVEYIAVPIKTQFVK